jgi:hypothetical protein
VIHQDQWVFAKTPRSCFLLFVLLVALVILGIQDVYAQNEQEQQSETQQITITGRNLMPIPDGLRTASIPLYAQGTIGNLQNVFRFAVVAKRARQNSDIDSPCPSSGNPSTPNPVVIATGEKLLEQDDFSGFGINALPFSRIYRSITRPGTANLFGPGWLSTYDLPILNASGPCLWDPELMLCMPASVTMLNDDGATVTYTRNLGDSEYYANGQYSSTDYLLYNHGVGWVLTEQSKTTFYSLSGLGMV